MVALGVLAAILLSGCRDAESDPRPNLILILIDNLRADHLGLYGYARPTSPNIDALGASGVVFERASATSSWTKPSVASLFTSLHPSEHNAVAFGRHLAPDVPTLAESLQAAGYRTIGVTANFVHVNERWGFDRGFDSWHSFSVEVDDESEVLWRYEHQPGAFVPLRAPNAGEVNQEVLERLDADDRGPVFVYVHYMEPHSPYTPEAKHLEALLGTAAPAAGAFATNDDLVEIARGATPVDDAKRQWLIDLYDAEILGVDAGVGVLLAELQRRGVLDHALVVLASDHGEEFGEHGGWFHALTLHRESLSVPLVIRDTRSGTTPARIATPVDLVDVPTTLLAAAGVPQPAGMRGRALLAPGELLPRDLVAELHADPEIEDHIRPRTHRFALSHWPWKAIVDRDGTRHVYRSDRDADEATPLAPGALPAALDSTARSLAEQLGEFESGDVPPGEVEELDPQTRNGLRALGYAE